MRWLLGLVLILVMLFCIYGVLATVEPGPNALAFRFAYITIGVICFIVTLALGWSMRKQGSPSDKEAE